MSSAEGGPGGRGAPGDEGAPARAVADDEEPRRRGGLVGALREVVLVVVTALVLSLLIKTFLVQAFFIPSESMQPTLEVGDRVLVSRLTPGPFDLDRGDVVVFTDPGGWLTPTVEPERTVVGEALVDALSFVGVLPQDSGDHLIKRVVGLPGDTVAADGTGALVVNGEPLGERYLYPGDLPSAEPFTVVVPEGRLWVMGDHRSDSLDSRAHTQLEGGGTVPLEDVVGRAVLLVWPLERWDWLSEGEDAFRGVPATAPEGAELPGPGSAAPPTPAGSGS
ncbi:signal peptidase I [uncultured Pseudokineococcus sp.]|uniref:signal peptidase I n=1 Tax=uncultured Pseudokineococcus sp. TaxID=1642928 RepID=UPI002639C1E5|nr:signal peptidase I [uncultured Pseudokineococcus sp.]